MFAKEIDRIEEIVDSMKGRQRTQGRKVLAFPAAIHVNLLTCWCVLI